MARQDDYFDNGRPICRESLVAYVDILGSKQRVLEASTDECTLNEYCGTLHTISANATTVADIDAYSSTDSTSLSTHRISDLLVLTHPLLSPGARGHIYELELLLTCTATYQCSLSCNGHACRGAVSIGSAHSSPDFSFGPALVECNYAEENFAKYPRILLLRSSYPSFAILAELDDLQARKIKTLVCQDSDGEYFIDYLSPYHLAGSRAYVLADHKNCIEISLSRYRYELDVMKKYEWMSKYHNYTVQRLIDSGAPDITDALFLGKYCTGKFSEPSFPLT